MYICGIYYDVKFIGSWKLNSILLSAHLWVHVAMFRKLIWHGSILLLLPLIPVNWREYCHGFISNSCKLHAHVRVELASVVNYTHVRVELASLTTALNYAHVRVELVSLTTALNYAHVR